MPLSPSLSPPIFCTGCRQNRPALQFARNSKGAAYKTCNSCKSKRRVRQPLQELDPNAPARPATRGATDRQDPAIRADRPRKRQRRIDIYNPPADADGPPQPPQQPLRPLQPAIYPLEPQNVASQPQLSQIPIPQSQEPVERPHQPAEPPQAPVPLPQWNGPHPRAFLSNYMFTRTDRLWTIGHMSIQCTECSALHFIGEAKSTAAQTFESCCKLGDVYLDALRRPPEPLRSLLTGQDPRAKSFRSNIRMYNGALAFTSVSYGKDTRLDDRRGVSNFSIHGELFHLQGPLEPGAHDTPAFAQLFFYDPAFATDVRSQHHPQLDRSILRSLADMLTDCNVNIRLYKTARERLTAQRQLPDQFRLLISPQMRLVVETGADLRRENLPICDEIAGILPYEYDKSSGRDIVLAVRNPARNSPQLQRISVTHAAYMPLHYVIFFCFGDKSDLGWHYGLEVRQGHAQRKNTRLSQRVFYRYRLHTRAREFSALFYGCRLFQQYVIDAFAACETTSLDWLRAHQDKIRADVYSGVQDALIAADANLSELGRRFVLPSSFTGGDRFMQQLFQDSMAIVRFFGKPDFFITFTANPKWPEIVDNLFEGQTASDRPDLVARVFHLYIQDLLTDLRGGVLGPYAGHVYTIEYQKRGLPHMHLLLFLKKDGPDFKHPANIDQVISAELPDPAWDPTGELAELVTRQMCHGPCGPGFLKAPCMKKKTPQDPLRCEKRFPKPFAAQTTVREDGYPEYRRRNDGRTFTVPKPGFPGETVVRNNQWVVPHNPYLLRKYRSHLNVEVCATVQAVKYIHKYVYKGADRTTVAVTDTQDEIAKYLQARYVSPPEACWRLFEYRTHQEFPSVQHLAVHLEGKQPIYFDESLSAEALALKAANCRSTLMAYFKYNTENAGMRHLLYPDFPGYMTWQPKTQVWQPRKNRSQAIGRMYHCSPVAGERYYLRLLLTVLRGKQSFTDLRTVDGFEYPTFQAACIALGLADNNQEWIRCFQEAKLFTSGRGLRTLFLTGLRHQMIPDPMEIWVTFQSFICDDLRHRLSQMRGFPLNLSFPEYDYGLFLLSTGLADQQRCLTDVQLPEPIFDWALTHANATAVEDLAEFNQQAVTMQAQFNPEQLEAFTTITIAISTDPQTAHFYLQGPGGTGKTFLYTALCHYYRGRGMSVLCCASTGIAALLLPNGRTSHSAFKIPIVLNESSVSGIAKNSRLATDLRGVGLVIWDEVPMQHKTCFDVVHRLFRDIHSIPDDSDLLFGGVPVILGGDFAQILPVIPNGSRADIVTASLQHCHIWPRLRKLRLRTNMRVRNGVEEEDFVHWISKLPYDPEVQGSISLPTFIDQPPALLDLKAKIYPPALLQRATHDYTAFNRRAILTTLNATVTALNTDILKDLPGPERVYQATNSADVNEEADGLEELSAEFLQSIDIAGLPLSELKLKIGAPVMLLRNLCPDEGLCNGTRMIVTGLQTWCLQVCLLGGRFDGESRTIPRIKLESGEKDLPFTLTRKQFPVRLAFVMTINKSQGQSLDHVGVDLRTPVFSHGQFYVAMTRVSSCSGLHVLLPEGVKQTQNVVWPEVLQALAEPVAG